MIVSVYSLFSGQGSFTNIYQWRQSVFTRASAPRSAWKLAILSAHLAHSALSQTAVPLLQSHLLTSIKAAFGGSVLFFFQNTFALSCCLPLNPIAFCAFLFLGRVCFFALAFAFFCKCEDECIFHHFLYDPYSVIYIYTYIYIYKILEFTII